MPELRAHFPGEGQDLSAYCLLGPSVLLLWLSGKELACLAGDTGSIPGSRWSLREGNGNPLHILAWRIPWTEDPSGLWSIGSHRVGNDLVTKQHQHSSGCEERTFLRLWGEAWARLDCDQGTAGFLFSQGSCPWFQQTKNKYYLPPKNRKSWRKIKSRGLLLGVTS